MCYGLYLLLFSIFSPILSLQAPARAEYIQRSFYGYSILLSPDSYELLKYISSQPNSLVTNVSELSEDCLSQLVHYKLIEEHMTIYTNYFPVVSSISITELGKGYLYGRQSNDAFQQSVKAIADSAKESADSSKHLAESTHKLATDSKKISKSAETCADLAYKKSKKADIKGWISIGIAAFGAFIEFAIHHSEVIAFVKSLLGV